MKTSNNWEKDLQDAKAYCQQVNGLSHCKNCGIDFDGLISKIKEELATQKAELEKKHKEEMKEAITFTSSSSFRSDKPWTLELILNKYGLGSPTSPERCKGK